MAAYWYQFGTNGNPNGGSQVHWPKYTIDGGGTVLRLDTEAAGGIHAQVGLRKEACDFQERSAPTNW